MRDRARRHGTKLRIAVSTTAWLGILMLTGCASPPKTAAPVLLGREELIAELLEASGIAADIQASLPASVDRIRDAITRRLIAMPSPERVAISRVLDERFAAARIRGRLVERLARDFEPQQASAVLAWLRSPLGQRVVAMQRASEPLSPAQLVALLERVPRDPELSQRRALAQRLENACRSVDRMARYETVVALAPILAIGATLPPSQRPSPGALENQMRLIRAGFYERYPLVIARIVGDFLGFSAADFARVVEFEESAAAQWWLRSAGEAYAATLEEAAAGLAQDVGRALALVRSERAL